jgi:NADH dehydrogenase
MNITILGGTGFVGMSLINCLAKTKNNVTIITRNKEKNKKILVYPNVALIEADVHNVEELTKHSKKTDVLINLIGILNEKGHSGKGFRKAHSDLARIILTVCKTNDIKRILHMGALKSDPKGPSHYLRTKGEAESYLMTYGKRFANITIFKPSVIFGKNDSFILRFSNLLDFVPYLFPLACHDSKFAPIFVDELSDFIIKSINDSKSFNKQYDLCGPKIYNLKEILEIVIKEKNRNIKVIPLSKTMSKIQASIMEFVPGKPFSVDNFNSCQIDSVCESDHNFYSDLETIVPTYIKPK